ncbi:hypothetical protein V8C42DRAFT_303936 [Trichoderma barbatum]
MSIMFELDLSSINANGEKPCNLVQSLGDDRDWEGNLSRPCPVEAGPVPFLKPDCGMEAMLEADYPDARPIQSLDYCSSLSALEDAQ